MDFFSDITKGGKLVYVLSDKPSYTWGDKQ